MINFALKGKNFPASAHYWGPNAYTGEWVYFTPVGVDPSTGLLVTKTAQYERVPEELGFMVFFRDAMGNDIIGPYGWAQTSIFLLKDKGSYILDFHGEVGIPTLLEEEAPAAAFIQKLWPWPPWAGPPLPRFFPPWPWWKWETGIPS